MFFGDEITGARHMGRCPSIKWATEDGVAAGPISNVLYFCYAESRLRLEQVLEREDRMALGNAARCWRGAWAAAFGLVLVLTPWLGDAQALEDAGKTVSTGRSADRAFQDWLEALRDEARGKGISDATLNAALGDIAPVMRVIELDRRQPEFTQTFWSYLNQRVGDQRIKHGRRLLAKHRDVLNAIHAKYGVPSRYLLAFWGLETNFGDYFGGFRVIDALVTLAYDRRRPRFFRAQLLDALQIIEEGHVSLDAMTGSWAGAMGHMQFMPSTFIGHAVDYTGDGRKDIWGSLPDALASAANYLSDLGWRPGEIWGREVRLPPGFDLMLATMDRKKTLKAWSALGVRRADGKDLPQGNMKGSILLPQGHQGPAFLVYDNFRIILRWNRSINYAICVGHLADRIIGWPPVLNGQDAEHEPLSRDEIEKMQRHLNRLGFCAGPADGLVGPCTKAAIRDLQEAHALPPDGYPTPALLHFLLALPATSKD
jgi:membrane-bound lytic murein transglycosylase B